MKITYFVFALVLLTPPVTAQNKNDATPSSSTLVLVNGQPIKGIVLEIDGKHFVAVEDLAQSLRGTISYGNTQIALTVSQLPLITPPPPPSQPRSVNAQPPSPQTPPAQPSSPQLSSLPASPPASPPPSVPAQASETGRIQGTLTYFFDFHVGNKPDTGSKVWLVPGHVEIPADQEFIGTSATLGTSEAPEQYKVIKYSIADENGHFELPDIPPGEYTLIMQSAHTKGTLKEKRNLFGRGNGRNPRDRNGRVEFLSLLVKAGDAVDASKDFGPNIDL